MGKKNAISPVITTILLILISMMAVILVATIIIPFVENTLGEGKECFETLGQLSIDTGSGYTCYYNESVSVRVANITVKRGPKEVDIIRFKISVYGAGTNNLFEIEEGTVSGVKMLDGSTTIELPGPGEERTYSLTTNLNEVLYAEVYPVVASGLTCDSTDKADLEECM